MYLLQHSLENKRLSQIMGINKFKINRFFDLSYYKKIRIVKKVLINYMFCLSMFVSDLFGQKK